MSEESKIQSTRIELPLCTEEDEVPGLIAEKNKAYHYKRQKIKEIQNCLDKLERSKDDA